MQRILFLVLSIAFCLSACNSKEEQKNVLPRVIYKIALPEKLVMKTRLPGYIHALEESDVRPQVDGIIQERLFEEGSEVKPGQVLYRIDADRYRAAYKRAEAELMEAEAAVTALAQQEKRRRNLSRENAVSRQELDNAISDLGQARARIAKAKAALETARINLDHTEIRAPIAGRIGKSSVTPGALVTAYQTNPLAVIRQTERVHADITMSSNEALRLRRAMAGEGRGSNETRVSLILEDGSVYAALENKGAISPGPIYGKLLFTEMAVNRATGSVLQRTVFGNPDGLLLPGMYVLALVEERMAGDHILVPQGSVVTDKADKYSLYVLKDLENGYFTVERRAVRLGKRFENRWLIEEGLRPGEKYIVEGHQKAMHGSTVTGEQLNSDSKRH